MRLKYFKKQMLGLLLVCVVFSTFAQEKPNILWITFEDTSPQFIGCYGDADAETPVIDKMAAEGIRYTSAFSTNTVCSPSRTAIITGVPTYKLGTGNHRSNYKIPDFVKGFPKYLRDAGYYVTNNSKTDYNVNDERSFIAETWDESSNNAGWWNREKDQPFFSVFNIPDSHQSRTMSMSYEWYEKNFLAYLPKGSDDVNSVPYFQSASSQVIDAANDDPLEFNELHEKHWIADTAFSMPSIYRDSPEMRRQMARVYNSLKLTDIKIGKLLTRLKQEGLMENTIVFIFADHGEGMPRMKTNGIGLGYRVPFIVWLPERYKHLAPEGKTGVVSDRLLTFEDLAPTVLDLAGVTVPEYLEGKKLLGNTDEEWPEYVYLASDRADNGLDLVRSVTDGRYMYSRNFMPFFPELKHINYINIGEITQQMREDLKNGKLNAVQSEVFASRPVEVLYDLKNDKWETNNLATSPEYDQVLSRMRDSLFKHIVSSRDIMFMPEYEIAQLSQTDVPYDQRMNIDFFPLREILNTAKLVGQTDDQSISNLLNDLEHPNKFVRYWAALGLYNSSEVLKQKQIKKISAHLGENYLPAKVTLAMLLYNLKEDEKSLEVLKHHINAEEPNIALMIVNYLLYTNERTPFIEAVTELNASDAPYKVKAACLDFLNLEGLTNNTE